MNVKVMADLNEELNSVTSDSSFVILGNGPPSLEVNDADDQNGSFHKILTDSSVKSLKSMENAMVTLNHNSEVDQENPNDIQLKLDHLVKDNLLLKETLNQSNLAMKNQFCTLSLWYDEVVKTHESHKQKFLESQEQISKLQMENTNLKKIVEEKLEMCNVCNGNYSTVMVNVCDDDDVNALKKKLELSEETINNLNKSNEELVLRNKELERKQGEMMEKKLKLEKELEEALQESNQLKKNSEIRNDKCNKCQSSLDSKNVNETGFKVTRPCQPEGIFLRPTEIEPEWDWGKLKEENDMLKRQLTEQQEMYLQNSVDKENMKIQHEELMKDKEELQNTLKTCRTIMEQFREQVKGLTIQVKIKEELLERKMQELEHVKKEMEKLVLDCEEVAILRAQVELYQNDFNEERNAREKAVGEKEQMAEEVRLLKRMMKDMMKDINLKREVKQEGSISSTEPPTVEVKNPYVCSICSRRFATSPEWECHTDECLTFHAFP